MPQLIDSKHSRRQLARQSINARVLEVREAAPPPARGCRCFFLLRLHKLLRVCVWYYNGCYVHCGREALSLSVREQKSSFIVVVVAACTHTCGRLCHYAKGKRIGEGGDKHTHVHKERGEKMLPRARQMVYFSLISSIAATVSHVR